VKGKNTGRKASKLWTERKPSSARVPAAQRKPGVARVPAAQRKPDAAQVPAAERKPRADAQRNRERILEVAKQAFTRSGLDVSLDDIAKQAEVGPGTLYRHFPTRDVLLEAVYRTEVERLAAAQKELSATLSPLAALQAWMLLFVDYIATKQIIAPALNSLVGGTSKLFELSGAQIRGAIHSLVERAVASGDIRADLDPLDLLRALVGVSNVSSAPDWKESAQRLVQILLAGSHPASTPKASR
jgi:AcrR family transcriptional regulator